MLRNLQQLNLDGIQVSKSNQLESLKRKKRSYDRSRIYAESECPLNYCEEEDLTSFCSPSRHCPDNKVLPNCWFKMGVRSVTKQKYKHYLNKRIACMPACSFSSKYYKMPALEDIASVGRMCKWFFTHGRCPEFRPPWWLKFNFLK